MGKCRICKKEVPLGSIYCQECGKVVKSNPILKLLLTFIQITAVVFIIAGFIFENGAVSLFKYFETSGRYDSQIAQNNIFHLQSRQIYKILNSGFALTDIKTGKVLKALKPGQQFVIEGYKKGINREQTVLAALVYDDEKPVRGFIVVEEKWPSTLWIFKNSTKLFEADLLGKIIDGRAQQAVDILTKEGLLAAPDESTAKKYAADKQYYKVTIKKTHADTMLMRLFIKEKPCFAKKTDKKRVEEILNFYTKRENLDRFEAKLI